MFKKYWPIFSFLGVSVVLLAITTAPAQRKRPDRFQKQANMQQVVQQFPSKGPMQTAWKVNWRTESGSGLIIQDAFFKKHPHEPWVQIIGEARLAESFVPYHPGSPRFWDVSYNFGLCPVTAADGGPHGKLLSSRPGKTPDVVLELRDQGVAWKDSAGVRRGEQLVLWATLSAANYRYIIEYSFRDDGLIKFRCAATGHNYPGSEGVAHMHNHMWRIDVNLGGPDNNSVELCEHLEPDPDGKKTQAVTRHTPFNNGKEGYADFDPAKFTMLQIVNTQKKNSHGKSWSYDLVPQRMGNSRHYGGKREECAHHDFWVTKNRKGEILYTRLPEYIKAPDNPNQPEDITDTDVVIWYCDPGHHEPRSEDGEMRQGRGGSRRFQGATPVMWTTFDLRPRDFWDRSPYFPYKEER